MIILDLEWNRGYDKTPLDEILQIGAVKLERPVGPIVSTFCAFIRPKVHKKLNRTAKLLPEVGASLGSALDFPTAYREFVRWCGEDTHFAAWGCDDLDTLAQNCAYWRLPPLSIGRMSDLQTAFSLTLGTKQNIALWWAAEYCQVPDSFTFHNALHDAVYTASLIPWISPEALELSALDRRALRLLRPPFPPVPDRPTGPHPTLSAALNAKDSRRGTCPVCGARVWLQSWHWRDQGCYYTVFRCPRHGRFLYRLTLASGQDGRWRGTLSLPPVTPPLLASFSESLKGQLHVCQGGAKRRRRPRRRNRKKASAPTERLE